MTVLQILRSVCLGLGLVLSACYAYQIVYLFLPLAKSTLRT